MRQRGTISLSVEYGLRLLGLWPSLPYAAVIWCFYVLMLFVAQYFLYLYAVIHFDVKYISHLIDCLSIALAYTLMTVKLINLWLNRRAFHEMLDAIDEDWEEASVSNSKMTVMVQKAELSRRCSNGLMSFNAMGALFYVIGGYITQSVYSDDGIRKLPVMMEFPFDISASPIFELTMLIEFVHQLSVATLVAMMNALVLTLVLHASGQIDIICDNLRNLTPQSFESVSTMRQLVYQHQRIIDFSNNINEVFSVIALLEFLWNTIVICCIGFAIVASIGTEDAPTMMTKSITYYIAISLEAFIFCYGGEYLCAKSKSIGDAVYDSLWYNLKPRQCQVLVFIIARSQKHLTITAGSLMDLSLETFTSIMKASASYASVLHAMY